MADGLKVLASSAFRPARDEDAHGCLGSVRGPRYEGAG